MALAIRSPRLSARLLRETLLSQGALYFNTARPKYAYDRQVDVHGHWIGLAMLLIVLAIGFDRVGLAEKFKLLLAWTLLLGSVLFPLGVLLQTWSHGPLPKAVTILGSALVLTALTGVVLGFLRRQDA